MVVLQIAVLLIRKLKFFIPLVAHRVGFGLDQPIGSILLMRERVLGARFQLRPPPQDFSTRLIFKRTPTTTTTTTTENQNFRD